MFKTDANSSHQLKPFLYVAKVAVFDFFSSSFCRIYSWMFIPCTSQTITFLCDKRDPFLEVLPEDNCAYAFIVHTALACVKDTPIGVECQVEGFQDLVAFQRRSWNRVTQGDSNQEFFVSVCDPLGSEVEGCSPGAAACMHNETSG